MQFTRKNVWELGGDWADPILWYARGVAAMKARALAEPTAWRFYGGIHGFDQRTSGSKLGYLSSVRQMPSAADQRRFTGSSVSTAAGISCPGIAAIFLPLKQTSARRCTSSRGHPRTGHCHIGIISSQTI